MKKIVLTTLLLVAGFLRAQEESNFFSLNKTTIDLAKNETLVVSYEAGSVSHAYADYSFYFHGMEWNNPERNQDRFYLDITVSENLGFTEGRAEYSIPISFNAMRNRLATDNFGHYEFIVRFVSDDGSEVTRSQSFDITIINSAVLNSNIEPSITDPSGTWFDRSLAGTGFYIMQYGNGTEVRYNGYTKSGEPLWLVSNVLAETWLQGEPKTFVMYEASPDGNTNFNTPPAVVPGIVEWGSLTLQFDSCKTGVATLDGADGVQAYQLTKLANPINVNCIDFGSY